MALCRYCVFFPIKFSRSFGANFQQHLLTSCLSHLGNSLNISKFLIMIAFVTLICYQ